MTEMPNITEKTQVPDTQLISSGEESSTGVGVSVAYATKEDVKSSQNLLLGIMAGIVIFVVVTFWIESSAVHRNYAQDKSILLQTSLQNNQLNKDYFDKVLFLNNEVQNLKMQLEVLRAKNPYLK